MKKRLNRFPKGWTKTKVDRVLSHYEGQSDADATAEDEDSYQNRKQALVAVPIRLLPVVRQLIAGESR